MAGGTWNRQDKTLPGFYLNIKSHVGQALRYGESGTVVVCQALDWGPVGKMLSITAETDVFSLLGHDFLAAPELLFLRELFCGSVTADGAMRSAGAQRVLLYRPEATDAAQASATLGSGEGALTVKARYVGTRGNALAVSVSADPDTEGTFVVTTYLDAAAVDMQSVSVLAALRGNDWVEFTGSGAPAAATVTALTGGANGTASASAYADFLTALEPERFDVVVYDGTDTTTATALISFVRRLREEEGRKVRAVLPGVAEKTDYEGVISPVNGLVLKSGTLSAGQSCWWVGGCAAGARYNQDMTYAVHPDAVDVFPKYSLSQARALIQAGNLVFFEDDGSVRIFYDSNTLTTFTAEKTKVFSKNRPVRTLDYIANSLYRVFSDFHIGQTDNTEDGRKLFKKEIVSLLNTMQAGGGVKNFTAEDVEVTAGEGLDAIVVTLAVQPVDAVSKIYMTATVS